MICNVYGEEDQEDVIKRNLIERNRYLKDVENIEEKIKFIFKKPAKGSTQHFVFKCEPEIRALINKHGDCINLNWGRYFVRDRYHVQTCYHCQRLGHITTECPSKQKREDPVCYKCSGNHMSKDCTNTDKKCINCIRHKKPDTSHSANESCCPVYMAEIDRARASTDHGY